MSTQKYSYGGVRRTVAKTIRLTELVIDFPLDSTTSIPFYTGLCKEESDVDSYFKPLWAWEQEGIPSIVKIEHRGKNYYINTQYDNGLREVLENFYFTLDQVVEESDKYHKNLSELFRLQRRLRATSVLLALSVLAIFVLFILR